MFPKNQLIKSKQVGLSQFLLLVLISLLAISLPLTTKLVKQSQDSRSSATDDSLVTDFNFKLAFKGVKPEYSCLSNINSLNVDIVNTTTNTYDSVESTSLEPITNEVNNDGDQVFKVTIPINYNKFNKLNTSNYLRIRSNSSLAKRYCINNQDVSIDSVTNCNINIHDSINIYDFSNYSLTPGDLNQDGVINSSDYSTLKNNLNLDTDITCNQTGDLNQDGIINSLDSSLIKNVLTQTSEELVLNTPIPTDTTQPTNTPTKVPTTIPTNSPTKIPTLTQTPTKTPTPTPTETTTLLTGSAISSNSTLCQNQNGICATYNQTLTDNTECQVSGYSDTGVISTGICSGNSKTFCCAGIVQPTATPTPTLTTSNSDTTFAPIVPSSYSNRGITDSLKVWRVKKSNYSLVYVWAKEPYKQLHTYSSSSYGKDYDSIANIMNKALKKVIDPNKLTLALNLSASVFYTGVKDISFNKYTSNGLIIEEGKILRDDVSSKKKRSLFAAIDNQNNLNYYYDSKGLDQATREATYQSAKNSGALNIIRVMDNGVLVKDGKINTTSTSADSYQGFCQLNKNNFVYFVIPDGEIVSLKSLATILKNLGCKDAYRLDGGGSTALWFKPAGKTEWTHLIGNGSRNKMWNIFYWTEL